MTGKEETCGEDPTCCCVCTDCQPWYALAVRERELEVREFAAEANRSAVVAVLAICCAVSLTCGLLLGATLW